VATAPKMKPAKAAGKLNRLPGVVGSPKTAQKQAEANDQSRASVNHASGNLREKWRVPAKPVQTHKSPTATDTEAELFSTQLLAKVESLFENFNRLDNIEYFEAAEEWRTLNGLFFDAGKDYAGISHAERDRRAWVEKKIRSDRDAIDKPKVAMVFCMRQSRRFGVGIAEVRRVLEKKIDFAMREGICEASRRLGSDDSHSESTLVQSKLATRESIFSADYRQVKYKGKTRRLTPQLAKILRVLDENKDREVTSEELHNKTGCSKKISDSFRSKDGKPSQ
jgi:hypothetical protein